MAFEYNVIPAPTQMKRSKGAKTAGERLAIELQDAINEMAAQDWEYVRSDTLTVMDKPSRFSRAVEMIETVLVFRRPKTAARASQRLEPSAPTQPQPIPEREEHDLDAPILGGATKD